MHVYEIAFRYERKIAPKDYENIAGYIEGKVTLTADESENALEIAESLLVEAREKVVAGITNKTKATGKTTGVAEAGGRAISENPEDRREPEASDGEKPYDQMTTGEKRAFTRRKNAEEAEAAAVEAAKKDGPKEIEVAGAEPGDDANVEMSAGELKTFIQDAVRKMSDGQNNTETVNEAKRLIAESGDGAQASGQVPVELRGAVRDAIQAWMDGDSAEADGGLDSL